MTNPGQESNMDPDSGEPWPDDEVGEGSSESAKSDGTDDAVLESAGDESDAESTAGAAETESAGDRTDSESAGDQTDSGSKTRRWRRVLRRPSGRALAVGAGAVLLVAALATAGVLGWNLRNERLIEDARQQALATAKQYAVVLTSVDASKLDQNFAAVIDGATGEFKDMYSQSSAQLKQVLIDHKAKAEGKVIAAGIKSATQDKVEVMLFVDQSVTNSLNPEPRLDRSRLIMTMEKVDGRWLASNVELP